MNPTLKSRWLEALRSGKYIQGKSRLRTENNTFCCLGVLCDISGLGKWKEDDSGRPYYVTPEDAHAAVSLPIDFPDRDQILSVNVFRIEHESVSLMELNDCRHFSFLQIADVIEKHL